eukprot:scaffold1558_cov403-Prasinococcus_capsulatus_cf.AAC.4
MTARDKGPLLLGNAVVAGPRGMPAGWHATGRGRGDARLAAKDWHAASACPRGEGLFRLRVRSSREIDHLRLVRGSLSRELHGPVRVSSQQAGRSSWALGQAQLSHWVMPAACEDEGARQLALLQESGASGVCVVRSASGSHVDWLCAAPG